ncbi:MAG: type II toxin-antitoxin system death-on-curing family toxin [Chthoniobacteraceae bacterium]
MKRPEWILRETVLALHEQLLAEFGGSDGIRDGGLLDSALSRPENLLVYGQPTVSELAASYAFGLVKNHPFVDGNKRIGFAIGALFLQLNGRVLMATEVDAVIQTLALAAGETGEKEYACWLEANSKEI